MRLKCSHRALLLAAFITQHAGSASSQEPTLEQSQTFQRMQQAPTDHDNTFAYIRASIAARDYEGAIAALERILTYNPDLSRAKYELGVLYFRLKSYEQAAVHFEDARQDPSLDPAVSRRIDGFMPEVRKQLAQSRFTGVFQLGYRYNSNVAGVPGSGLMRSFGLDLLVPRTFRNRGDGSAFVLGEVSHVYDFQNQRGDIWETRLAGYATRQFTLSSLDVGLFEFSTGPRLALAPDALPGWTIRPYAATGGSMIDAHRYGMAYGGGVTIGIPVTQFFGLEAGIDGQRLSIRQFGQFDNQGILSTGSLWTASLAANWSATDAVTFSGKTFVRRNSADNGGISSNHFGLEGSVKVDFAPPTDAIGMNWSVTPFVRYTMVDFVRANPVVDPTIKRQDRQFRAGVQLDMPFTATWGLNLATQYTHNASNIRNFRSSSWSILAGPTMRF